MRYVMLLVAVLLIGIPAAGVAASRIENELALESLESPARAAPLPSDSTVYRNDPPSNALGDVEALLRTKIAPSLMGALLLLGLSVLFSTVNFYTELRGRGRSIKNAFRYLLVWIFMNYVFALLFLVLILPDGMSLASVSRTLLMYCLVATALPELSANIRLQLGRSDERTLDLYKYKTKVSELIARRMDRASAQTQSRDRAFLEAHYESQPDEFLNRFRIFVQQGDVTEAEQAFLKDKLLHDPSMKCASAVLDVVGQRPALMRKTLEYFGDDIDRFRNSPKARLMKAIQPDPTRDEMQRLVAAGITSAGCFLLRTTFEFQRRRLAAITGLTEHRVRELRVSTHDACRRARRRRVRLALFGLAAAAAVLLLLAWHGNRLFPTLPADAVVAAAEDAAASAPAAPTPQEGKK